MMWCQPESSNIDLGSASVNIDIITFTSHHVQYLDSQQLFLYIFFLNKKSNTNNNEILAMDYVFYSLEFFFTWWQTDFIQLKEEWMHNVIVITTADRDDPDQGLHCLLNQKWSSEIKKNANLFRNCNLWPLQLYNGPFQVYCINPERIY